VSTWIVGVVSLDGCEPKRFLFRPTRARGCRHIRTPKSPPDCGACFPRLPEPKKPPLRLKQMPLCSIISLPGPGYHLGAWLLEKGPFMAHVAEQRWAVRVSGFNQWSCFAERLACRLALFWYRVGGPPCRWLCALPKSLYRPKLQQDFQQINLLTFLLTLAPKCQASTSCLGKVVGFDLSRASDP
jgi:hypothetical protein